MEIISLTINDQKVTCPAGTSILLAAEKNGIKIPTLCYHPDLKPYGACRICLVEDEKTGRLMASCVTPAAQDMSILTDTPRVLNHRKNIVRLMMAEHPESCIVCSKGNRCELRNIAATLGVGESDLYPMPNYTPYEQLNPFIIRDLSKCILCGKCIRADHELVGTGAIDYNHRGFHSRPATLYEKALEDSICTFCGTCVSICPTGALSVKNTRYVGTPEKEVATICEFCGVGCSLTMGVAGETIIETNPTKRKISVNGATLCMRGHFANDFINSSDRLTRPMVKSLDNAAGDSHAPVSWDEAFDVIISRLSEIKRTNGPESIAFVGSPKCTNEENYLFQKIARHIFKTPHVMCGDDVSGQKLLAYIEKRTHGGCRVMKLSALEKAEAIIVINGNPAQTVPVAGYHIKRAAKKGSRVIVIDPFHSELTLPASLWIRPDISKTGQMDMAGLINALGMKIFENKAHDMDFINQYTDGLDPYTASLADFSISNIAQKYGLPEEIFDRFEALVRGRKIAFVLGPDSFNLPAGDCLIDAVLNLVFLTGSIGGKGAGIYVAVRENNLVGAMDMGAVSDHLPGRERILDVKDQGMALTDFIVSAEAGKVRAAYIMGANLVRSLPQTDRILAALQNIDFLVVQDILCTRTTQIADVILPGAAAYEKHGSFTNMEGRIQTFVPTVSPPGEAREDWDILAQVIKAMGYPEQYLKIEKIRQEIRQQVPMYQGLGNHQQGWIQSLDSGAAILSGNGKFLFLPVVQPDAAALEPEYPFIARISPPRFHLGGGTRTSRSERIRAYNRKGEVEISPADLQWLGLNDSGRVRVKSVFGSIEREYIVNPHLMPKTVYIPMGVHGNDAVNLLGLGSGEISGSLSRVNIEKI